MCCVSRCPVIGYHQPYLLQNRIPTHVHLWPTVSVLNIHQKCIKSADYYCSPTLCQALNLFWLRGFPITLNCQRSLLTVTPVTTLDLFSVCIYIYICVCVTVLVLRRQDNASPMSLVIVFALFVSKNNVCDGH